MDSTLTTVQLSFNIYYYGSEQHYLYPQLNSVWNKVLFYKETMRAEYNDCLETMGTKISLAIKRYCV